MALAILHSPEEWTARFGTASQTVLSVGNFDGLHLGHQKILRLTLARARASGHLAAVLTFDPHPMRVLRPGQAPLLLQTLAQRLAGFAEMGLDAALVMRFDRTFSLLSPEDFLQRILVERLCTSAILVGANFCFGHRGAGDVRLLSQFAKQHHFDVETVAPVQLGGKVVSSTTIRNTIAAGDVAHAAKMLGRPFALTGTIQPGEGRGRTILFPTLNLAPEQEVLPGLGVYATQTLVEGDSCHSVTNVGTRPTFDGHGVRVESHLLGFERKVTEGPMEVRFHARLRAEQKFSSPQALREQIARDIKVAHEFFAGRAEPQG